MAKFSTLDDNLSSAYNQIEYLESEIETLRNEIYNKDDQIKNQMKTIDQLEESILYVTNAFNEVNEEGFQLKMDCFSKIENRWEFFYPIRMVNND
jgi:predicted  nucleic acid-binding Zn-ribbon protein